ncbi:MAG TPA: hypothetical protein VNO55_32125, partial [Polyangia bacterium]|nr:hypothetical protein [Polyangia bacterium]
MIARAVAWSAHHPRVILVGALLTVVLGEWGRRTLERDVIPDLSDPQIALVADWMGHPATEVASAVTTVLSTALG